MPPLAMGRYHADMRGSWWKNEHVWASVPRWTMPLLVLALGCGDDRGTDVDSGSSTSTTSPQTTTGGSSTGVDRGDSTTTTSTTTGLDSTGSTGRMTTGLDSTGTSDASSSGSDSGGEQSLALDDTYFVRRDQAPLLVDAGAGVLANDIEAMGGALTVSGSDAASAAGGVVDVQADGSFSYTPPAGFIGDDSFGYTADDGVGQTADGVVRVTVGPAQLALGDVAAGMGGFVIDGESSGDESGVDVSGGGDINGDGLDDLVVTSIEAGATAGRAWVVFGKADGMTVDLADVSAGVGGFPIEGESAVDPAAISAAIVGDVNGDGLADVLIGAPDAGLEGRAYLVHGKADGALVDLGDVVGGIGGFVVQGDNSGEQLGAAVDGAGDVDGDGLDDLLIGAPVGGPIPNGGRAYVVLGKTDTLAVDGDDVFMGAGGFVIHGAGFDDFAGESVAGAGDVNADGLADVVVGAALANAGGQGNSGRCYVVFGRIETSVIDLGSLGNGGYAINGEDGLDEACRAVSGLGDVNGDGLSDVAVGAPFAENTLALQGRVYVVHGKGDTSTIALTDVAAGMGGYVLDGEALGDFAGTAVGGPGDMDGDGFADVIVGTANVDVPGVFAGRGYVVFGKTNGVPVPLTDLSQRLGGFYLDSEGAIDDVGWAVSGAGDVDGDGFADAIISARRADPPGVSDGGRSYVVFGGNYGGVTHLGGPGDDEITASSGVDAIVAGAGADLVHGLGGSDVLYGGAGDDVLGVSNGQFFRVRGGSGFDTLAFEDGGVQLDLTVVPNVAIVGLEAIDLTGDGDNVLMIALDDLRAMVGPSRTLRLLGDSLDAAEVDLSAGSFSDLGVMDGVHRWSDGTYTLEVVEPLGAIVLL